MSEFDDDFAAADDLFAEVFGVDVEYWRGAVNYCEPTAEVVTMGHDGSEVENTAVANRPRSYLIAASELVIDSETVTPRQGDRIKETIGGTVHVFEVMRRAGARDVYEWVDVNGGSWVVHTKFVGTE